MFPWYLERTYTEAMLRWIFFSQKFQFLANFRKNNSRIWDILTGVCTIRLSTPYALQCTFTEKISAIPQLITFSFGTLKRKYRLYKLKLCLCVLVLDIFSKMGFFLPIIKVLILLITCNYR